MSLASARLLMAATAGRTHAAALTSRLGFAATYTRCASLHSSPIHAQRGFGSAATSAGARPVVASSGASAAAPSSASPPLSTLRSQLLSCVKSQRPADAERLIREFEERGGRCDVAIFNLWIRCHSAAGDWQGAEHVWARFGDSNLKPDSLSYCALLQVYTQAGGDQLAKIEPLVTEMQAAGLTLSARDYGQLIKSAHQAKRSVEVRRWAELARAAGLWDQLDEATRRIVVMDALQRGASDGESSLQRWTSMSDQQKRDSSLAISKLLSKCAANGDSAAAEGIIADCDRLGIAMTVGDLNAWISCYRRDGDWQAAERVWARFGQLSRPTSVSYATLLQAYMQAGGEQLTKIDRLLSEMQIAGLTFGASDYQKLIKSAHHTTQSAEVRRWTGHARAAGLWDQLDAVSRGIVANHTLQSDASDGASLLRRWARMSDQQKRDNSLALPKLLAELASNMKPVSAEAEGLIAECDRLGIALNVESLTAWMACCERAGDWQAAERAWKRFDEFTLKPNSRSYRALMQVYTHAGREQLAKIDRLLEDMQAADLTFAASDYPQLIKSAHHARQSAEVRRWAAHARAAGLWDLLDTATRGIVAMDALQRGSSDGESSLQRWTSMSDQEKRDNSLALSKLLFECAAYGDSAAAERIIVDCDRLGIALDVGTLTAWISCHEKGCDWKGAERVWAQIGERKLKPGSRGYRALLQVYTSTGGEQLAKIEPLVAEMQRTDTRFSAQDFEQLIMTAHRCKLPAEVRRWSDAARAAGLFAESSELTRHIASLPANQRPSSPLVPARPVCVVASSSNSAASSATAAAAAATTIQPSPELQAALDNRNDAALVWRLLSAFELEGGRITARMYTRWLRCFLAQDDWQGAEHVWARMKDRGVTPDSSSYVAMMHIYTKAGGPQLAKIDPMLAELQRRSIALSVRDYENLIGLASRVRLPSEVRRWSDHAHAAGLTAKLSSITQNRIRRAKKEAELQQQQQGANSKEVQQRDNSAAQPTSDSSPPPPAAS